MTIEEVLAMMDVSHGDMREISLVWRLSVSLRNVMYHSAQECTTAERVCDHEIRM